MYRSFTDRVFGGVCGGLGALLPVNAWVFRVLFAGLALVTTGAFAALYLMLWWALPAESLAARRRGGAGGLLLVILLTAATAAAWWLHVSGGLRGPSGQPLFWPGLLTALAVIFCLRQFGRRL